MPWSGTQTSPLCGLEPRLCKDQAAAGAFGKLRTGCAEQSCEARTTPSQVAPLPGFAFNVFVPDGMGIRNLPDFISLVLV